LVKFVDLLQITIFSFIISKTISLKLLNQILFYKVIWYIKWRTLPMPGCSGLYGPGGGGSDAPPTKNGIPLSGGWGRAHSILLRRRKNQKCSELKMLGGKLYLHATTGSHLDDTSKNFSFLKSSSVSLWFRPKKPKSRSQSTLFEFKKLNYLKWSSIRGFLT
jgi:hypothetical protein